jgi:choline dehydrogenase-like flavoprotein
VEHQDFDVIVVGGGGAGLAAALEANNAGASVLICEAAKTLGGSAAVSAGLFLAADTQLQKAQGVYDSADDFYDGRRPRRRTQCLGVLRWPRADGEITSRTWIIIEPANTPLRIAPMPFQHRWLRGSRTIGDLTIGNALDGQQDDSRPSGQPSPRRRGPGQSLQPGPVEPPRSSNAAAVYIN